MATAAITDLREVTDERDPGSANLSLKGGKAKVSYWWTSTNVNDFHNMARLILGQADIADPAGPHGGPGIARLPPIGHPRFPTLFAETLTDFAGLGGKFVKEASFPYATISDSVGGLSGAPLPPNFPQYARYPEYKIDIEFANRLYALIPDAELGSVTALSWNDQKWDPTLNAGKGGFADDPKKCWDTFEYNRWTWVTGGPKENIITAKQGQMVLDYGNPAVGQTFPDSPKLPLPDGAVVIKWFEVPYIFVRPPTGQSFFQQFMGRVNQFNFMNWAPGELMYVVASAKPYKSPIPTVDGYLVTLCDIDIICLETQRLIATGDATPAPALANWIAAGWNLQPWNYDRQFHYAHVGNIAGPPAPPPAQVVPANRQTPVWKSFPMEILFSNPNVALPP